MKAALLKDIVIDGKPVVFGGSAAATAAAGAAAAVYIIAVARGGVRGRTRWGPEGGLL